MPRYRADDRVSRKEGSVATVSIVTQIPMVESWSHDVATASMYHEMLLSGG